mgnify:CR=1 FL=1
MIVFRSPYILLFFFLLFIILWVVRIKEKKHHNYIWGEMDPKLKEKLFLRLDINLRKWKDRLTIIGLLFLIFSAAGPQIGTRVAPIERKGVDLVFAVDVSESMNAEDIKPSRLEKSKFEISQIINQLNWGASRDPPGSLVAELCYTSGVRREPLRKKGPEF